MDSQFQVVEYLERRQNTFHLVLTDSNQSLSASLTSRRSPTKMTRSSFLQFEHLAAVALSYTWVFKLDEYFVELNTGTLGILESGYDLNTNS